MSSTTDRYEQRQQQQQQKKEREREREEAICFCCCCSLCVGVLALGISLFSDPLCLFSNTLCCCWCCRFSLCSLAHTQAHTRATVREKNSFLFEYARCTILSLSLIETLNSRLHCNVNTCVHSQIVTALASWCLLIIYKRNLIIICENRHSLVEDSRKSWHLARRESKHKLMLMTHWPLLHYNEWERDENCAQRHNLLAC